MTQGFINAVFSIIGKDLRRAGLKSGKAVASKDADVGSEDVGVVSLTGKVRRVLCVVVLQPAPPSFCQSVGAPGSHLPSMIWVLWIVRVCVCVVVVDVPPHPTSPPPLPHRPLLFPPPYVVPLQAMRDSAAGADDGADAEDDGEGGGKAGDRGAARDEESEEEEEDQDEAGDEDGVKHGAPRKEVRAGPLYARVHVVG